MQVRLEVAHSKANVKKVVLRSDAVIGRSAECGLRIASSLVSRQHCQILLRDNQVFVRDLESSNGTFLNGAQVKPNVEVPVPPGSELSVGGVRFYVRYDGAAPVPSPGSTVDLPNIKALQIDPTGTAEWKADEVPAAPAKPGGSSAKAKRNAPPTPIAATPPVPKLPATAPFPMPAEFAPVAKLPATAPFPMPAEDAPAEYAPAEYAPVEPETAEPEPRPQIPPLGVRVAMSVAVPVDPMAAPSVVPADVPAAAPEEDIVASQGDEIDTLMIDAEQPSEQETIDAGMFRFDEMVSETFDSGSAAPTFSPSSERAGASPAENDAERADAKGGKKAGLRSLFSIFGRKKIPRPDEQDKEGTAPGQFDSAAPAGDTVSDETPGAEAPASPDDKLPLRAATAIPVDADDAVAAFFDEPPPRIVAPPAADLVPSFAPADSAAAVVESEPQSDSPEQGFQDFLKSIESS